MRLVHLRRYGDVFDDLMLLRGAGISAARIALARVAAVALHREFLYRKIFNSQRLSKRRCRLFEVHDTLGVRHLMDAIYRRNALAFQPVCDALICAQHEFFD